MKVLSSAVIKSDLVLLFMKCILNLLFIKKSQIFLKAFDNFFLF